MVIGGKRSFPRDGGPMSALSSTKLGFCWAGAALVLVALGCGGSTDSPSGTGASAGSGGSGASGGTGGSSTGGTGGSSTGGSGGSTGGSGGTAGGQPDGGDVICNGVVCPPTMFGGMSIPACCTAQDSCGISIGFGGQGMCIDTSFDAGGGGTRPEAG